MTRYFFLITTLFFTLSSIGGCSNLKSPSPGIAVGNHDLDEDELVITPTEGDETYIVLLLEENAAEVSQIRASDSRVLEVVETYYSRYAYTLHLQALFSDGKKVGITIELDASDNVVSISIIIDGRFISASFETDGSAGSSSSPSPTETPPENPTEEDVEDPNSEETPLTAEPEWDVNQFQPTPPYSPYSEMVDPIQMDPSVEAMRKRVLPDSASIKEIPASISDAL
jgi:hypothetical protein